MTETIINYQMHGAVNDNSSPDNVTLAAEVVDFEWFSTIKSSIDDGFINEDIYDRQRKEAFYFIDFLIFV